MNKKRWSWKLGRIAGIDTYVHASFLLLMGWAAWAAYQGAGTGAAAVLGVVFLLAVFGSVLLHELGHALMARRYGIRTRDITLLPIGGVAALEDEPRNPRQELAIALAGPAVNFAIAIVLFGAVALLGLPGSGLLGSLLAANVLLGAFNLLPAFPMDGGRALRALLATRVGAPRATEIAVKIGKGAALLFGIYGLFNNFMLVLIAGFVWIAASAEGRRRHSVYRGAHYGRERIDAPASAWFSREPERTAGPSHGWVNSAPRAPHYGAGPRQIIIVDGRPFMWRR